MKQEQKNIQIDNHKQDRPNDIVIPNKNKAKNMFHSLPEYKRKILEQRALIYSKSKKERITEKDADRQNYITFTHAREKFGINITNVIEIQQLKDITYIPNTPAFISGAVNVRGNIILVVNIMKFLNLKERGISDLTKIIIVQAGSIRRGILADDVSKKGDITVTDVKPPRGLITEENEKFISGVTDDMYILLNVNAIINDVKMRLIQDSQGIR